MVSVMRDDVEQHIENFQFRVLQEAMAQATRSWWLRRSEEFLAARPKLGEFHGERTPEQLSAKWRELTDIADACRARAEVAHLSDDPADRLMITSVLQEVA